MGIRQQSLTAIESDGARQSALDLECPPEKLWLPKHPAWRAAMTGQLCMRSGSIAFRIARDLAHDCRSDQNNSALSHHFHEITKTEFEPEIPTHAEDDDLAVEMAALEEIINAGHPSSL
jgi:hypothetical protein